MDDPQSPAPAGQLLLLIGAPLFFFISVIYVRVLLELMIVIFRIADHTAEIGEQNRMGRSKPMVYSSGSTHEMD